MFGLFHHYSIVITVLHSLSNLFYIINIFSNTISTHFVSITAKKVRLILFWRKFVHTIWINSLYESYLTLSTIFIIFCFNHPIQTNSPMQLQPLLIQATGNCESCFYYLTIFIFLVFVKSLYESYLPLSTLFLISYFKHLMQNRLSADTYIVHEKGIFGVYL